MTLSLQDVQRGLLADPRLFAQKLDFARNAVLIVRMDEAEYRAASFLDDRILTPTTEGRWTRLENIEPLLLAAAPPALALHFIFHSGHVGSTLISRFLDTVPGVLGLREPLPLRALAEAQDDLGEPHTLVSAEQFERALVVQTRLWRRGYGDTRAVIVKATSSAGRLAPCLLRHMPEARALYVNLAAEPYLATLLAGKNSSIDLRGMAGERMRRLTRLGVISPTPLHAMGLGEIAAMTWAAERLSQAQAHEAAGARVIDVDFDAFLTSPGETLRRVCAHFGLDAPEAYFAGAPASPLMTSYAKAPEFAYSPQLRAQEIAAARAQNAAEIAKGRQWLERAAAAAPKLAALTSTA